MPKPTSTDFARDESVRMAFWEAINRGRAEIGAPEALFANVFRLWQEAMVPTATEVKCAIERAVAKDA